jgi:ABC-type branched-subunit amino acid transport system substrate-binding protein
MGRLEEALARQTESLAMLREWQLRHPDLMQVLRLSRNFGSMAAILAGIEAAATAAGRLPTRNEVATAIRALTYTGLTGTLNFDANGDLPLAPYFIVKVNATTEAEWLAGANETVASFEFAPPAAGSGQ